MHTAEKIHDIVNQSITEIAWDNEPLGLYAPIDYVLALGGKRIRPALVLMSANLFSDNIEAALKPAIGIEIFHNFTLLHDDIMDLAPVRRKQPTVHVKWNENTAILSGDAMLIKAYQYMASLPAENLAEGLAIFSKAALEVCEGQQYDMEFESRQDVSQESYLEMIRLKTAVLLGASLQLGAIIGGSNKQDAQLLYDFGINIGLAFQLKDDLLDVYGESHTFGKQIGGDILCNKKTYLLINALQNADGENKIILQTWLAKTDFDAGEKIKAITSIFNQIGVKALCEKKMDEYFAKGLACLEKVSVSPNKKENITLLANQLMSREF
jgi:geranylgeranyl diphosphate synthase type II